MADLSANTLMIAVQAVDAAIEDIMEPAGGDITRLDRDEQELLEAYSLAEAELKQAYLEARRAVPSLPAYEELVHRG